MTSFPPEAARSWPLWAGSARVVVRAPVGSPALSPVELDALAERAQRVVRQHTDAMDAAASRFRADSEVCQLAAGDGSPRGVSPLLLRAVEVALRAAEITDGAVDPTLGASLVAVGYDADLATLPASRPTPAVALVRRSSWRDVALDTAAATVAVPPGVLLDLGATAKALAADLAAADVAVRLGCPVLVALAGDLAIAGSGADRWAVGVRERPDEPDAQVVDLGDGGVATSTTRARRWEMAGQPVHHLLDPVTGLPAREVWRTVTVVAGSCVDANTASTACVVKGEAGRRWLEGTGLPARLVAADGQVVALGGWPAPVGPSSGSGP